MPVRQKCTASRSLGLVFLICLQMYYISGFVLPSKIDTCGGSQISKPFVEFYGASHEEYNFTHNDENDLFLQFSFCTSSRSGILAKLENFKSYQSLLSQVQNSRLIFSTKKDNNWIPECGLTFENTTVDDGVLHTVIVRITQESLDIQLFSKGLFVGSRRASNSCCGSTKLHDARHRLQIGGDSLHRDEDGHPHVLDGFVGCMRDIRVNGVLFHDSKDQFHVTPGCSAFQEFCTDVCPPPFEMTGGICRCPFETEITANGKCVMSCACIECRNRGTCVSSSGQAYCHCRRGFSGKRCETPIDPCSDVFCHNGTCFKNATSYTCLCNDGFKGEFCTEKDACANVTCKNNGICQQNDQSETICLCPQNYIGKLCEISESENTKNGTATYIVIGILVAIIILFICACVCWIIFTKREIFSKTCKDIFKSGNSTNPHQHIRGMDPTEDGNAGGSSETGQVVTHVEVEIPENPLNRNRNASDDPEPGGDSTEDHDGKPENVLNEMDGKSDDPESIGDNTHDQDGKPENVLNVSDGESDDPEPGGDSTEDHEGKPENVLNGRDSANDDPEPGGHNTRYQGGKPENDSSKNDGESGDGDSFKLFDKMDDSFNTDVSVAHDMRNELENTLYLNIDLEPNEIFI